jgi:hypothetical protein
MKTSNKGVTFQQVVTFPFKLLTWLVMGVILLMLIFIAANLANFYFIRANEPIIYANGWGKKLPAGMTARQFVQDRISALDIKDKNLITVGKQPHCVKDGEKELLVWYPTATFIDSLIAGLARNGFSFSAIKSIGDIWWDKIAFSYMGFLNHRLGYADPCDVYSVAIQWPPKTNSTNP